MKYLSKYPFITINQPAGRFYVTKINASKLIPISQSKERNPYNYTGIQRKISTPRVTEIAKYCDSPNLMFPTPIILSGKSQYFTFNGIENSDEFINLDSGFLEIKTDNIIKDEKYLSIVDGQHRLMGISQSSNPTKFDLLVMFIFDTENYEDAEIFSVINRNQKQVSKSLVYDLYGLSNQMTVEKFSHEIVKAMNTEEFSLLQGRIKMLGYKTDSFADSQNYETDIAIQYVTQGALVDKILPLVTKNHIEDNQCLLKNYQLKEDKKLILRKYLIEDDVELAQIHIVSFFNEWISKLESLYSEKSILFKTVGFIAAFKIFDMAYKSMYWLQINKIEDELKYTRNYEDLPSRYQSIYRSFIDKLNFSALDESKISSSLSGASYVEKSLLIMSVKDMMKYKNHNISYKMFYDHVYNETNHKEWEKIERKYTNLVLKFDDRAKNYDRLKREAVFNDFSDDKLIDDALTEFEKSFYDLRKYYVDTVYSEHDN